MNARFKPDDIRLVIFDWDGTLMDSERQIVKTMQAAIADLALEPRDDEACKDIIGLGLKEAIARLYPGSDDRLLTRLVERYRYHWLNDTKGSELFPGAVPTLNALRQAGLKLAVATGKGRVGLEKVMNQTGLHGYFDISRCSDETRSKPHPQMLHEILDKTGIENRHALMVGDTEYDLQMAHHAGVGPVAVSYGVHDLRRLLQCNPLACLDRIEDLSDWLLHNEAGDDNPVPGLLRRL